MPYLLIHHKVSDYETWKSVFDEHASTRKENGSKGGWLLHNAGDPNDIFIILEWDSVDHARRFVNSEDLKQTMKMAGVSGSVHAYFLEQIDRPES